MNDKPPKHNPQFSALMRQIASHDETATFMGWPDRWFSDVIKWRCENGHVCFQSLRVDRSGWPRDVCLVCEGRVSITDPDDYDGKVWPVRLTRQPVREVA